MIIKQPHRPFKPLATAGSGVLLATLLSACGGGPLENNSAYQAALASGNGTNNLATNNGEGKKYLTYEEWKAEEAKSEEARKKAEEEAKKQSEVEQKKQEEEAKRQLDKLILESANTYEQELFDKADGNTPAQETEQVELDENGNPKLDENGNPVKVTVKKPVYVVVGLDDETRWADQLDKWGRTAKFVSLHGHNLYSYYNKNCPVTEGLDPERLQGEEGQKILRNTYRCMAGIYVGRTESGKMCYTFFDRGGKVSHINDNTAVYPFRPGFVLRRLTDKDPQWDEKKGEVQWTMESPYNGYYADSQLVPSYDGTTGTFTVRGQTIPMPIPVFSRLDVGRNMFMILNLMRRYPNPAGVSQKLDIDQAFRTQQAVFKFNSSAQTIDIYQYNTDSGFGTGPLDDTCYVNFRSGMAKEAESTPNTSTSSSSN